MSGILTRRSFLAGTMGLGALLAAGRIRVGFGAVGPGEHRFVSCYFNGGWDILLGPDPRDTNKTYEGINLGLNLLDPSFHDPLDATIGSTPTILGPTMGAILAHTDLLTLFRGVNMNTVAHASGRAYVNTFQAPSGATPRGSSISTAFAAIGEVPEERILPNVSIGMPSFNTLYQPQFTAVPLGAPAEILDIVRQVDFLGDPSLTARLHKAQDASRSCVSERYGTPRPGDLLLASRERTRKLLAEDVGQFFDFGEPNPEMMAISERYGLDQGSRPGLAAATTSQLLKTGLARSVAVQLQNGLDSHGSEWAANQPALLVEGFNALGALLTDLREDDPGLANTTVIVHSEFSRTPLINGQSGRDHFFPNCFMVFGSKLHPGVFGATREDNLGLTPVDLATGLPSDSGVIIKPEQVAATLLASLGADYAPYRQQPIESLIKGDA
jgi:hypothetical protein